MLTAFLSVLTRRHKIKISQMSFRKTQLFETPRDQMAIVITNMLMSIIRLVKYARSLNENYDGQDNGCNDDNVPMLFQEILKNELINLLHLKTQLAKI